MDNVNHPKHYENSCSLECIDTMFLIFGDKNVYYFCLINAYKYMWRWKNKNGKEDLDKAEWYLNKADEIGWKNVCCQSDVELYAQLRDLLTKARKEIACETESGEH